MNLNLNLFDIAFLAPTYTDTMNYNLLIKEQNNPLTHPFALYSKIQTIEFLELELIRMNQ